MNDEVEWCEPEMLSEMNTANTFYPDQYYLRNTGQNGGMQGIDINVEPAWQITNGSPNITVAVIDQGVDINHEDMGTRVLQGFTIRNPQGFGAPQNTNTSDSKGHGMACAGIVAATNNTIGVRGIASNINILPVNIVPDFYVNKWITGFGSNIEIAEAINWAWKRADLLSCSWGGGNYSNDIVTAIDSARTYGRNGRGCVVIFSSGNDHFNQPDVSFPGNVNGVITVGAINNQGNIWNYSQRGSSMDLVALSGGDPGDVVTTDRMGNLGYESGNYTSRFGGTSAACPQVAGVAALLLSIRPELTSAQVTSVLQNTARDLGPVGFDNTYGYGLVNAVAAIQSILPTITGPSSLCNTATYTIQNLPQGATVQWSNSNTGIAAISGSGANATVTKVGNGEVQITATITVNGGSYSINRAAWIGTALINEITGTRQFPNGGTGNYFVSASSGGDDTYNWSVTHGLPITFSGPNASITFPSGNADYAITVTVTNSCGFTSQNYYVSTGEYFPEKIKPVTTLQRVK